MTEPDLTVELQTLFKAMVNSARLLYKAHSMELQLVSLVVLAYLAYRFGRSTVTDPLDNDVKDMSKALKNRQHYTVSLPQKMKKISTIRRILVYGFIALTTGAISIFYFKHDLIKGRTQQQLYAVIGTIALLFLGSLCLWIYEVIIAFAIKKGNFNDHAIHKKLSQIVEILGKKTQLLIKAHLCREKYLSRRNKPLASECSKNKCKEYRKLSKQKANDISGMVQTFLNFQWCSLCRKRIPYDQFLDFQSKVYHKNEQISVEKEVSQRNQYLLFELERMSRWVQELTPCNCSKRYWIDSTKEIRQFKKQQKAINQQLALYQQTGKVK